jgi:PEP-CTERM motif
MNQVIQTLSSSQGAPDLKLNNLVTQDPAQKGGTPQSGPRTENGSGTQGGIKTDSIIAGVTITGEGKTIGVETIEEGEVEGTICDCGDILVAGGGFPKWPFILLAAVPLAFIHDCEDCNNSSSSPTPTPPATPTPTPTPPGVPEPASLFLLGTGLAAAGAGLRRRYAKPRVDQQLEAEEE